MVTLFGDLFIEDADGAIHFTDTVEGAVAEQVCHSADDFDEILESDPDDINWWFKPDLVEQAQFLGLRLGPGQCYGFKIHPQRVVRSWPITSSSKISTPVLVSRPRSLRRRLLMGLRTGLMWMTRGN